MNTFGDVLVIVLGCCIAGMCLVVATAYACIALDLIIDITQDWGKRWRDLMARGGR
jgi:hypothetical protein